MNCDSIIEHLSAWIDDELPTELQQQVATHVQRCDACRALAEELRTLDQRLHLEMQPYQQHAHQIAEAVLAEVKPVIVPWQNKSISTTPWRTWLLAVSAAAAGFLLAWLWLPRPAAGQINPAQDLANVNPSPASTMQLTVASGAVEIQKDGNWTAMPTGGLVGCGVPVRTSERGRCEFRTPDGSEVRLNHGTEMVFNSPRQIRLQKGQVWSTVAKAPDPFQVFAATMTVTALGTQFDLAHLPDRTMLSVLEGNTRVENQGKIFEVGSGHQFLVDKQQESKLPKQEFELCQATNWVHEILVLKGRDNPELSRRINDIFAGIGHTKMEFLLDEEIRLLGDHAVIPLIRYLQSDRSRDEDFKRRKAARLLADLAQPRSIGELIPLLTDRDPQVRAGIAAGLKRLTGQELGYSTQAWQAAAPMSCQSMQKTWQQWWADNQSRCAVDGK
ncbi:MAG: FecR domain-containing protein [Planctomycetia bacterium]|nr:FecR domain-containing protein [Planctomycetia bacterium]